MQESSSVGCYQLLDVSDTYLSVSTYAITSYVHSKTSASMTLIQSQLVSPSLRCPFLFVHFHTIASLVKMFHCVNHPNSTYSTSTAGTLMTYQVSPLVKMPLPLFPCLMVLDIFPRLCTVWPMSSFYTLQVSVTCPSYFLPLTFTSAAVSCHV